MLNGYREFIIAIYFHKPALHKDLENYDGYFSFLLNQIMRSGSKQDNVINSWYFRSGSLICKLQNLDVNYFLVTIVIINN